MGDVHQTEVVVDDVDLAGGPVVLVDDFTLDLVYARRKLKAAGLFRRERKLRGLDARLQRNSLLPHLDFRGAFAGRFAAELAGHDRDRDRTPLQPALS